jgi:hypothetical protein
MGFYQDGSFLTLHTLFSKLFSVIVLFLICASSVLDVRSLDSNSLCVYVVALQNVLCLVCH